MADLEDKILRQNVPGRWSSLDSHEDRRQEGEEGYRRGECRVKEARNLERRRRRTRRRKILHDEDSVIDRDDDINEDDEEDDGTEKLSKDQELMKYAKQMEDDGVPDPIKRRILEERERMPGTGVKGVLADYKTHLKLEQARKDEEKRIKDQIINRMVNGARIPIEESHQGDPQILLDLQFAINQKIQLKSTPHEPEALDLSDDDDFDDNEDEMMLAFRQQRMKEMIANAAERSHKSSNTEVPLPKYGECIEVYTTDEFLHHVDKVDPRTTVILHIYDPQIRVACNTLNQHLQLLAHEWIYVKIVLMNIDVNEIAIDRVALPALSIYRGGNCINVITAIAEELAGDSSFHSASIRNTKSHGELFSLEDIKWFDSSSKF